MVDHEALIETLSRSAGPVRRPLPPAMRAAGWMALAIPCALVATWSVRKAGLDWSQSGALWAAMSIVLSFLLGASAIAAAFVTSIAGRRMRLGAWFTTGIGLWFAANLACIASAAHPIGRIGSGSYCFSFMMLAGAPMIALVVAALRRTRAIDPERSLALAGLGIAFVALALLGFCHPVAGRLLDFTMHAGAAVTIVALTVLCGRRWVMI